MYFAWPESKSKCRGSKLASRSKQMVRGSLGSRSSGFGVSFPGLEQAARPRRAKSDINRASFLNIVITPVTFYILYIIS